MNTKQRNCQQLCFFLGGGLSMWLYLNINWRIYFISWLHFPFLTRPFPPTDFTPFRSRGQKSRKMDKENQVEGQQSDLWSVLFVGAYGKRVFLLLRIFTLPIQDFTPVLVKEFSVMKAFQHTDHVQKSKFIATPEK